MNSEMKYIVRGSLGVIVFFIAVRVLQYCFSYKQSSANPEPAVVIDNNRANDTITSVGKTLFMSNCAPCHGINKKLTGPALAGITERVTDKKLLYGWIRNNFKILKSGNAYFNALYDEYNHTMMVAFPNLTDKEIDAILAYIQAESGHTDYSLPTPETINL